MGLFKNEADTVSVVKDLEKASWTVEEVYSPIPGHQLTEALKLKKSKVGYITLVGGIIGFITGFLLSIYTAEQWDLMVSGKPIVSPVPFFIVAFELTILFSVAANVMGFLFFTKLPKSKLPIHYDPRCSGDCFGIVATCEEADRERLSDFFKTRGGEIKAF